MRETVIPDNNEVYNRRADDLVHSLVESTNSEGELRIIAVAGVSGSGKTNLAIRLASRIADSHTLHIDNYLSLKSSLEYNPKDFLNLNTNDYTPRIEGLDITKWDIPSLSRDIHNLADGKGVRVPYYNPVSQESSPAIISIPPVKNLIIEGGLAFHLLYTQKVRVDNVLVEAPFHDRFVRKLVRSTARNKQPDLNSSIRRYINGSELAWRFYENDFITKADMVLHNTSNPQVDYINIPPIEVSPSLSNEQQLIPLKTSGFAHDGEVLLIGKSRQYLGAWVLKYLINDRVLVSTELSTPNLELILGYYDLR